MNYLHKNVGEKVEKEITDHNGEKIRSEVFRRSDQAKSSPKIIIEDIIFEFIEFYFLI